MNLFGWWLNVLMATASLLVAVYAAPRAPTIAALSGAQVILFIWLAGSSFTDYHGISAAIRMENKLRPVADPDVRALPADQSEEELLRAG